LELNALHEIITNNKNTHTSLVIAIHGTGGVGKTQLVLEYIFSYDEDFTSVCWVNANDLQSIEESFSNFAQQLYDHYAQSSKENASSLKTSLVLARLTSDKGRIMSKPDTENKPSDTVKQWLRLEGNERWLLVFDNADDLDSFKLSDFFPNARNGAIVITSRRPECARYGKAITLHEMAIHESITLLAKSSSLEIGNTEG
jgi:hypothetical protein